MDKVRVNFKINKNLYLDLKKLAQKCGIPLSQILCEWLRNFKNLDLNLIKQIPLDNLVEYNFYIEKNNFKKLKEFSSDLGLNFSQYLRLIIFLNLNQSKKNTNLATLWNNGNLLEICNILENKKDLNDSELLLLARAKLEVGDITLSDKIKNSISLNNLSTKEKYELKSLTADILIYKAQTNQATNLILECIDNLKYVSQSNYSIISRFYLQLAEIELIQGKVFSTQFYNYQSLSYANIETDYMLIAENYMLLSAVNQNIYSSHLLDEAGKLIKAYNNVYYTGWYYNEEAMCQPYLKSEEEAIKSIKKGIEYHQKSGSIMKIYYAYALYAKFLTLKNDFKIAHECITKAEEYRNQTSVNSPFSTMDFLKLLIEAKSCYSKSHSKFKKQIEKMSKVPDYIKYLLGTIEYVFANDEVDRNHGLITLKNLAHNSEAFSIRDAAKKTIINKKFEYAR